MDKIIIVVGPTGSGKTSLSVELAKKINGEIISGDAYQCYREMNIGSAKIRADEMQKIPHYLVNELSYKEEYNVKLFQEKGRACIKDIISRKKHVIICGGTGLYIKALLYDYHFEDEIIDTSYLQKLNELDNETLYDLLYEIDKEATVTIHKNNRKRVIRALMMAHVGTKKSERLREQQHTPLYDAYIIGLTMERDKLYERIDQRVLKMMDEGLKDEIASLVTCEADFSLQSMRGIGYKEWLGFYRYENTLEETISLIQKNSRNFAKRQYTWFKNQMDVHWYNILDATESEKIFDDVKDFLGNNDEG